jgi:hypothetical protein
LMVDMVKIESIKDLYHTLTKSSLDFL